MRRVSRFQRTPISLLAMMPLLGSALAMPGSVQAAVTETDFLDELPVVLSVSRLSQPVSEAPAAVTIIDQDMIRASGFRDIPDLLRLVPGFSVAYTRDNTWAAGYHGLGDAYSRRFQVLVDGRSIYSPHYGAVNWTDLPLAIDDIERIEVVRGPNASIHGANSFAAVINIITKTAAQVPGEFVSMQAGTQDMRGLTVRHGGGDAALRYRLTASAQQRDRFKQNVPVSPVVSGGQYYEASQNYFVNGRLDWQLAADSDVMAQFGLNQGNGHAGALTADSRLALEPREQDSNAFYLQFAYHKVESARREWRVQAYHTQNAFDADVRVSPLVYEEKDYGNIVVNQYLLQSRSSIDLQVNEQWSPNLRAVWGGEVWQETVKSPQNYNSSKTMRGEIARAFGNLEWRLHERVLLQGGAMLEHHYFTGADISPRVAASFTVVPDHVLRLGVSRAYRSPTFFEEMGNQVLLNDAGTVIDTTIMRNGGLEPERILSRELGYVGRWSALHLELDVRLYRDRIDSFIGEKRINPNPPSDANSFQPKVFFYDNIGSVDAHGGEVQLRWRPTRSFDVSTHYARVFLSAATSVVNFNKDIPASAPRDSWGAIARYRFGNGWDSSVFVQYSDAQKWLAPGDNTQAFTRVDVRLARRWKWQGTEVEAAVTGQNLGKDYEEFRNTNLFSRRVYGSLDFKW
ncbi:MAG: TonB-dependent receptor [Thiobacillus sp.]|nr:TonB-dependent receptor [Thiobacillus sp.]